MRYDAVVIGAGVSGLAAALTLAREGRRTALIERATHVGPLLRRFRREGLWCDSGLHYLGGFTPDGSLGPVLRYLGLDTALDLLPMRHEGFDLLSVKEGEAVSIPCGRDALREALASQFPNDRRVVEAYVERVFSIYHAAPFLNLNVDPDAYDPGPDTYQSTETVLRGLGASETLLRTLGLHGYCLHGAHVNEAPFFLHAMVLGSFYESASLPARGGDAMVDAFEARLAEAGVDVLTGRTVTQLDLDEHRRVRGVRTQGREGDELVLECDACVATLHPRQVMALLPPEARRKSYGRRVERLEDTFSPFALYLEVEQIPDRVKRSNFYFLESGKQEEQKFTGGTPVPPRGLHHLAVMAGDWGNAPEERKTLCVLTQAWENQTGGACRFGGESFCRELPESFLLEAGNPALQQQGNATRQTAYEAFKHEWTERTLDHLFRHFPELRGRCRVVEAATPCTFERYTGHPGGAIYGAKHSVVTGEVGQLGPVHGLSLAGQSVAMPGVMGALISGMLAASFITGRQSLWEHMCKYR
ncbi:MAG TPA: NAD(P)/FAD-dependent oxidoreductase [Candidatus Sumerlaeota bacterium]|nr:NAD(P)/FAD-dependent oxidoreductase [Candidatus Sumerlaeota bacterium]